MKCKVCNGTGLVGIGQGIRGFKSCGACNGTGVTGTMKNIPEDACPICGTLFPTDDIMDFIPIEEINFCYSCGAKIK